MGEMFCGGRKCTTTTCELKMWAGSYTIEEKGRALGLCIWMPIITQATTLMPKHLETRKLVWAKGLPHLLLFFYTELWWVSDSQVF
jgi:hypothetical protein